MQTIFENKNKGGNGRRINSIGTVICVGRVGDYMEGKFIREFRDRRDKIWISRRIFVRIKKEVWRRR